MSGPEGLVWPADRIGEALQAIAARVGYCSAGILAPDSKPLPLDARGVNRWIVAASDCLGLEAEPTAILHEDVTTFLESAPPALLTAPKSWGTGYLALLQVKGGWARLLEPNLQVRRTRLRDLQQALRQELEQRVSSSTTRVVEGAGIAGGRTDAAFRAIVRARLKGQVVADSWLLRRRPGSSFTAQARDARVFRYLLGFGFAYSWSVVFTLVSWWLLGWAIMSGDLQREWLVGWVLALSSAALCKFAASAFHSNSAFAINGLLRRRLLAGVLRTDPDDLRHEGTGRRLGRALEGEALEAFTITGAMSALTALLDLFFAVAVLSQAPAGSALMLTLAGLICLCSILGWRYFWLRSYWTDARLEMTHDLVESMLGYRTRLAQERRTRLHEREDASLENYLALSEKLDRLLAIYAPLVARGWLVLGIALLSPSFVSGDAKSAQFAVGLGGVILAWRGLTKLLQAARYLAAGAVAWRTAGPTFSSASKPEETGNAIFAPAIYAQAGIGAAVPHDALPILELRGVEYRYKRSGAVALFESDLQVYRGDRILISGPSGGGKSTLVSVIAGLRRPSKGSVLLGGFDFATLGRQGWRCGISLAPQYYENHVLSESLAFNLLLGRSWPPSSSDLLEAEKVCRELGLGGLLDRMPSGLQQFVGESGWQLSHGEKSRIFVARALLKESDVLVLDEGMAALDPQTASLVLETVQRRASTLIVVAHP